jgi:hypothetical protein
MPSTSRYTRLLHASYTPRTRLLHASYSSLFNTVNKQFSTATLLVSRTHSAHVLCIHRGIVERMLLNKTHDVFTTLKALMAAQVGV